MSTSLLSNLSRGYGTWTGVIDSYKFQEENLPSIDSSQMLHRHGITPRPHSAISAVSVADGGHLDLPKTYLTRKGALMLFTAPDEEPKESLKYVQPNRKIKRHKNIIDLSLKLKTLERLSLSILQFGDKSYDKESASVSDKENNLFVNFLHDLNQKDGDLHSQPGADVKFYLRDLKRRASCRSHSAKEASLYKARSSELQEILDELEQAWPHHKEQSCTPHGEEFFHSPSPTPSLGSTRALSRHRILSSKKLAGSLKSVTYMGRPFTPDVLKTSLGKYARSKSATAQVSSPDESIRRKRPQTAQSLQRNVSSTSAMEVIEATESADLKDSLNTDFNDFEELSKSIQDAESVSSELEMESSDNDWYENTIRVSKTLKSTQLDETGDRENMLAEAATILSSLVEDEDIDVPYASFGDYSEEEAWSGDEQQGSRDQTYPSGMHSQNQMTIENSPVNGRQPGLAHPLYPQYLNVMNEAEKGSLVINQNEHDVDHALSRASWGTPFPSTRGTSPIAYVTQIPVETENEQSTSVSMNELDLQLKEKQERETKLAAMELLLKPPATLLEDTPLPQAEPNTVPTIGPESSKDLPVPDESITEPLAPKRRAKPVEIKTATMEEENNDVEETKEIPQFSERVMREKEEKERRSAKLREEKENAEIKKQEKEEKIKQEKEEKIKAAEERLRKKAEEAARKKEETIKENENKMKDLKQNKIKPPPVSQRPPQRQKIVVQRQEPEVPEYLKEMFARKSAQETEREMEEEILKMKLAVNNVLGPSITVVNESEGFTEEDFKAAQEALQEKIKKAEEDILENASPRNETKLAAKRNKPEKVVPVPKKGKMKALDTKKDLAKEREALREQQRQEKMRRLEEAKALQQKIHMKEEARKAKEAEAKRKAEEIRERMESIRQEEEELERAEQDAREQLAAVRKAQREEREARRKAELERKKQEAIEKREKEKAMALAARLKEQEMLESIADAEMARRLKEEDEARREEEEMEAQERLEAEFLNAQKAAEEEEERLRELERQAEEEAFHRILLEKEEAEERRWQLEEQAHKMKEEEEKLQHEMLEEEKRLEEERKKQEEEEEWRRAQEKARLKELQMLEEQARERLQAELEKRRTWALQRRDKNLEVRNYMDRIKQSQGITEPWTFSYFVKWPKDSYMRLMGADPKKIKGMQKPKPKPAKENTAENVEIVAASAVE
ncbi:polyamine-modulated factor 1-binding protein 1-like isoform X2 [Biomphalaria glabrata]|uniref:Polyamine-modulated factor 1-binding protein 1-like isoform X2 n=1 Tax=Biomphalaria glabrata TaxID=6526 RepID=A0A9W3ASC5_BIOGL|nr:polyamine-modulated factor 1-binding protein 1-like isoform X2 [Biomphalaria glabrata]